MKKKVITFFIFLMGIIIVVVPLHFFVFPKLAMQPFFVRYKLDEDDKKTVIINKTEQITVKENFSLEKSAERVLPAVVRIYFTEKRLGTEKKIRTEAYSQAGVIISGDGIIVTILPEINFKNKELRIFLADGRDFMAEIKKEDEFNGLLILKIETDNLPVAPFGESNELYNGEKLILSSKSAENQEDIFSLRIIQEHQNNFNVKNLPFQFSDENTEVFILDNVADRQFVGGPVIDFKGNIVGLLNNHKTIIGEESFVVPFENVKKSIANISNNNVIKEELKFGVYYLSVNKKIALLNNLPIFEGALVYSPSGKNGLAVLSGGTGEKIGLKINDIIVSVNGNKITSENTLSKIISNLKKVDFLEVEIVRGKEKLILKK
jgi:serine protease Do